MKVYRQVLSITKNSRKETYLNGVLFRYLRVGFYGMFALWTIHDEIF